MSRTPACATSARRITKTARSTRPSRSSDAPPGSSATTRPRGSWISWTALLAAASPEDRALLAELLSLPTEGRFPPLQLTPQRKKEKTFEALLRQLEDLARQGPVLMLFEDVHWIDPSSRELLDLADRARAASAGAASRHFPP